MTYALDAERVSKTFDGNVVLRDLSLQVESGSVHALLGHNGSGKSTFIKILAGYYTPDAGGGPIRVGSTELEAGNPDSSRKVGVSTVHQSLGLIGTLSVLENLRMGKSYETNVIGGIRWKRERKAAEAALVRFGLTMDSLTPLDRLSAMERTGVAIVRALDEAEDIKLLVLDEPTAALAVHEVDLLFNTIRTVQQDGIGVLYVSHRLEEVAQIADRVTILRDGVTIGEGAAEQFPLKRLIELISGDVASPAPTAAPNSDVTARPTSGTTQQVPTNKSLPTLEFAGVTAGVLRGFDAEARSGEILGIVGLIGSGLEDLAKVMTGRLKLQRGKVRLHGRNLDVARTFEVFSSGVAVVVAERTYRTIQDLTVRENLSLQAISQFFRTAWLRRRDEDAYVANVIDEFNILPPYPEAYMRNLSGGNQQKATIARAIRMNPDVIILEEPCQGVDAHGRSEITTTLRDAAAKGRLVVVIDTDLDEVVDLCTRVVVLRDGSAAEELTGFGITRQAILQACYGTDSLEILSDKGRQ